MTTNTQINTYVPEHLAIEAMRDNGYKNTAYAVAEIIDNSIQEDATLVELICAEEEVVMSRRFRRLNKIAVLDNGGGMTKEVLRIALQFGNGTRLGRDKRTGIGRFGMGLPASSISQCKRVDVWSWQNGVENAYHTYLDVEAVKRPDSQGSLPEPDNEPIPEIWKKSGKEFGKSGTLVVWSNLDRLLWSKANTLIDNSEFLIGRIYRKFINEGRVSIRLAAFNIENPNIMTIDKLAKPNDPLYLMEKTSCPEPYTNQALFLAHGDDARFNIDFNNEVHEVVVRFSFAKDEARSTTNAGATPYGRHAAKNVGVSIVRAGRELELDQNLVIQYDPTERWWGVEVEFPPSLDELMGVNNNKQSARNFVEVMNLLAKDIDSVNKFHQTKSELEEEEDPRVPLLEIANFIRNRLIALRTVLKQQTRGQRSNQQQRHGTTPEKTATDLTNERKCKGITGSSDADEQKPQDEKQKEIKNELVNSGVNEEEAEKLAASTVSNNLKYLFAGAHSFESPAFFTVRPKGGTINIVLNEEHPAYTHLVEVLEKDTNCEKDELKNRLEKAHDGLKLLLMAWARFEDELPDGELKESAKDARISWGRISKDFLLQKN